LPASARRSAAFARASIEAGPVPVHAQHLPRTAFGSGVKPRVGPDDAGREAFSDESLEDRGDEAREGGAMNRVEVRDRILVEHLRLRERLSEIEELADRFDKGGATVGEELRGTGAAMCEVFAAHLAFEDAQLLPILREIPERGEELAARLAREHREQRELLYYLVGRLEEENRPTSLVARELRSFCAAIRDDMCHEESTLVARVA
jgi:hemerythrin-like domain-containing protein